MVTGTVHFNHKWTKMCDPQFYPQPVITTIHMGNDNKYSNVHSYYYVAFKVLTIIHHIYLLNYYKSMLLNPNIHQCPILMFQSYFKNLLSFPVTGVHKVSY